MFPIPLLRLERFMFLPHSFLLRQALENTIAPSPITVTPDVLVTEAIALLNSSSGNFDPGMGANDCTGCLAVISENQLVGLFSERVVTRLVASGRSLAGVTLAEVIEPPAIALRQSELTNPEVALNLLQKHQIQHLPILDDNGQLLGLLTYESLCRLLQPVEPDRPDEASIAALKLQTERSQLLMAVSTRIRASLSLAETLDATVSEVRQFLGCDRVSIYHFLENGQFQVVAESLAAGQHSFVSEAIYDPCFASDWADRYGQGRVRVVPDIYTAEMTPCHVELLEHLQIRAKILVPAIVNNQFWGLVSASESAVPRDWQPTEVTFLEQLAIQVAIAIQHSETATQFQQQRQELTALLDRSPDVIFRLDRDLHYLYLNAAVEVELGYAPEALIGQPLLAATFALEHFAEWQTLTQRVAATREEQTIEYQLCLHSRSIWFQTRVVPEYDMDETVTSFLCVARNITQKKQAEARQAAYINVLLEWQNRHHAAQLATKQVLYEWDTSSDRVRWGINADQVFGYSASEMPQTSADWFASIHPEDEKRVQTAAAEYFEHQGHLYLQYRWQHQAGHYIWIEAQAQFFADANGNLTQIIGYVTDINERKRLEAERTQLETALRESEAQLRQIFDHSQDVFFLKSLDGKQMIYASLAWEYLYQTPLPQTYDNPQAWLDFIHPDDRDGVVAFNQQTCEGKKVCSFAYRIIRPDNSIRWIWNRSFPIRNEAGEIYRLAGVNIDITEQKKLELELSAVQERYQLAIRGIGEGVWDWDLVSDRIIASDRYWEFLGYPLPAENASKFAYKVLREEIHPDDRDLMQLALKGHLEDHLPYEVEFRRRKQSGEYIWCRSRGEAIRDQTGKPIRMVGAIADITERKAMATALQASEETLRQVVNTVPGVVYTYCRSVDGTKSFRFISQGIIKLCDRTPEEILNDSQVLWHLLVPEDGERVRDLIDQSAAMLTPWTAEFRIRTASGVLKWILGHSIPSQEEDGSIVWCGILTDISDRKQAELERQRSEALLQAFIAASPVGLTLFDRELRYLYGNEALAKINDLPLSEHLGRTLWEVLPEMASQFAPMLLQVMETQVPVLNLEFSGEVRPGAFRSAISNHYPVCLPNGEVIGVGVSVMDVTELVQAQQELRESEARFRTLADNISQFAWITDEHGSIEWYNQRWFDYTGTTLAEMQGWGWQQVHHPDYVDRVVKKISRCFETGEIWEDTFPLRGRDGQYRWFLSRAIPIRDEQGRVLRWFGTNTDITEQKQAEVALQTSEQMLRQVTNTVPGAVHKYRRLPDGSEGFIFMSERIVDLYEYTAEEILNDTQIVWDLILPEDIAQISASVDRSAVTLEAWEVEFRIRTPSGVLKWILGHSIPSQEEDGSIIWFGILTDISDRKQAELALQASERRYLNLAELSPVGIFHTDPSGECNYVNSRWCQLAGLSFQEAMGMGWTRALHPEDHHWVFVNWQRATQSHTPFLMEYRFQRPDGKVYWLIGLAIAETNIAGNLTGYIGTITDITERKYSEQALQESEQRYRDLTEAMPQMVWLADETGAVHYFNQRWYDYTGQSEAEAMGLGGAAAIHPDERDRTLQQWGQAITTGQLFQIEYRVRDHQGLYHWFLARGVPIQNLAGAITGWVGTITDIDDFKRAEIARKQSEARFRAVFEQAAVGIVEMDVAGRFLQANRRICDQLGYTEAEMLGLNFQSLIPRPDVLKFYLDYWQQLFTKKIDSFSLEKCVLHKNGELRWCNITVASVRDADGNINYCIGVIQDIQDRKQAELALQASEAKLNDMLNSAGASIGHFRYYPNGVWETEYHSRGSERIFGYKPDEFLAELWLSGIVAEDWAIIQEPMLAAIKAEIETTFEYRFHHRDGSTRWVLDTLTSRWNESDGCWVVTAIGTDESDRKQAELALQELNQELEARIARRTAALSESEVRYRALFEQAAVGISQCDLSGRYIQVNQRFCELTGYTQSELLDMSWQDLIHLEYLEVIQGELAHLHHGELASITPEIRYIRKDRRLQWVSLTVSMLYNAAGTLIGDLAVVEDISDRKHIEQQLQNSEKRLKEIISKTVDGILILNSQGQILFSNPAADRIFNCQKPDYQSADLGISITLQKTFEMEIPHPTGRMTTVEVRVEEITWQDHKAFLAAIRDISYRKQTEIDLQASELSYRTLAENLPGIVYKLYPDQHNTFVFFNDPLTTLFQLEPIDIANQGTLCPVNSLIVPEDRDRVIEVIQAAIVNQQPFQVEYCIQIPATQEKRYLLEQGSTVTDDIGQALHIVGIIFDVTEIKQTEEKLRKINERLTIANAELARATRLKDEFLANMSHELRTPLNSILGLSEVLQERTYGNLTEQQHHALTTIQTNGQHLLELINDILDLAKIESGKLYLQMTTVSVQQLCRSTIPFIQQQAFKKQISFTLELSPDLTYIELDERLIRQVLINLLANAVKFTPNGGAVILKVQGNAAEQTLSFSAIDTGIGIAPENIDKLFQPFVQIDSNLSRRYAGTGLGLALVRRIIELHKGSVTVRSTIGQGSQFTVVLPWKHVNPPNSDKPLDRTPAVAQIASEFLPVETKNIAEKPVVLLVDDNLDNIETLKAYLELKGFNIVVAHNGLQAINLTQTQSFNLILMDIQMPHMNGLEAIRQIRLQEQDKPIPILAVTALAMSGDKEQCLAAGANDYLTKPISPIHLVNVMKKYLHLS
ncbi:PAS domain S-box protein [Nostoc sp.]|uniref:PAS domain S-box protein n=1 Tax=Nostoc sp. TaxID=1180 RepID=UPI002FF5EB5A